MLGIRYIKKSFRFEYLMEDRVWWVSVIIIVYVKCYENIEGVIVNFWMILVKKC